MQNCIFAIIAAVAICLKPCYGGSIDVTGHNASAQRPLRGTANDGKQLLQEMYQSLDNSKTLQCSFQRKYVIAGPKKTWHYHVQGKLALGRGNRLFVHQSGQLADDDYASLAIANGKTLKYASRRGNYSVKPCEKKVSDNLHANVIRGFAYFRIFDIGHAVLAAPEFTADYLKRSAFRLGGKQEINGKQTRLVHYALDYGKRRYAVTTWIDMQTKLPVQRIVSYASSEYSLGPATTMIETFSEITLNEDLTENRFDLSQFEQIYQPPPQQGEARPNTERRASTVDSEPSSNDRLLAYVPHESEMVFSETSAPLILGYNLLRPTAFAGIDRPGILYFDLFGVKLIPWVTDRRLIYAFRLPEKLNAGQLKQDKTRSRLFQKHFQLLIIDVKDKLKKLTPEKIQRYGFEEVRHRGTLFYRMKKDITADSKKKEGIQGSARFAIAKADEHTILVGTEAVIQKTLAKKNGRKAPSWLKLIKPAHHVWLAVAPAKQAIWTDFVKPFSEPGDPIDAKLQKAIQENVKHFGAALSFHVPEKVRQKVNKEFGSPWTLSAEVKPKLQNLRGVEMYFPPKGAVGVHLLIVFTVTSPWSWLLGVLLDSAIGNGIGAASFIAITTILPF